MAPQDNIDQSGKPQANSHARKVTPSTADGPSPTKDESNSPKHQIGNSEGSLSAFRSGIHKQTDETAADECDDVNQDDIAKDTPKTQRRFGRPNGLNTVLDVWNIHSARRASETGLLHRWY